MLRKNAQTTIEYVVFLIIILAVFLSMQSYVKRAFQGRWKAAVDDLGEQYDPVAVNLYMNEAIRVNSETHVITAQDASGFFTNRIDSSRSQEIKSGSVVVGSQF